MKSKINCGCICISGSSITNSDDMRIFAQIQEISFNICKKVINKQIAKELLENKITNNINGFISKNNKEFTGKLKLEEDGKVAFVFN